MPELTAAWKCSYCNPFRDKHGKRVFANDILDARHVLSQNKHGVWVLDNDSREWHVGSGEPLK